MDVPHDLAATFDKDEEFFLTSKLKNGRRYFSTKLSALSTKLTGYELSYRERLIPLLQDMFLRFYQYRNVWNNAVAVMSELDALCSLA